MFFENYYILYNNLYTNDIIPNYKNIKIKFINKYVIYYLDSYNNNFNLLSDALIYANYYLNYKCLNCIYSDTIMNIIYNIDYYK